MKSLNTKDIYVIVLSVIIFIVDLFVPLGVVIGALYLIPILISYSTLRGRNIQYTATISSILVLVAAIATMDDYEGWMAFVNRGISLVIIWSVASQLMIFTKKLKEQSRKLAEASELQRKITSEIEEYSIITLDEKGHVKDWNKGAESIKGFKAEEIIGKHYEIFFHPEERKKGIPDKLLGEAAIHGRSTSEGDKVRKGGGSYYATVTLTAIKNNSGKLIGFSKISRDISEKHYQNEKFKSFLDSAPDAMIIVNTKGQIELANKQVSAVFGYTQAELIGKPVEVLIPDRFSKNHPGHRTSYFAQPHARSMGEGLELSGLHKSGKEFPIEISLSPIETQDGRLVSAAVRDITDRKREAEKFKALLESAPDAMIIVNPEGTIELVNEQVKNLFGYTKEEIIGNKIERLIPERFHARHPGHRSSFFANPKVRSMGEGLELLGLKKNGDEFPIEISLSPIETAEGKLVAAAVRDITERKRESEKFKALLESAPDAMIIVNPTGSIELVNEQVRNIFGYQKQELIGKKIEQLIPERFHKNHGQHRNNFFQDPKVRSMGEGLELRGLHSSGREFPIEISLSPIETADGKLVAAAVRDITDRKKISEDMKAKNIRLSNMNKELAQFAYIASHDLQEPLRTVNSFVGLLEEDFSDKLGETGRDYINFIGTASERMSSLVKGLLDYSRIGKVKELERLELNSLVAGIEKDFYVAITEAKAKILYQNLPTINGYKDSIRSLFQNLISNAIKFRSADIDPVINISWSDSKEYYKFTVSDNGIGIAEEHREKIFVIFQRLHSLEKYKGTGIGLAHCRKIIELHEGEISVESELDKGSSFHFTIKKLYDEEIAGNLAD